MPAVTRDAKNIPEHVAIIMDGNGRWAKKRGLPRAAGHREGAKSLREVLKASREMGVKYLTVYAFSTENWGRPKEEIDFLMKLLSLTIDREVAELVKNGVRLRFLGRLDRFSDELRKKMKQAMDKTANGAGNTLNIMVNYGGRAEIVDAVNELIAERGKNGADEITEQDIQARLYTRDIPDPDLLIRTASEMRISNFLLWQVAYSEIYVTDVCWPDFRGEQFREAIAAYQQRERRYGKL
ncbi:di-trans,poly-cis-decaprenylcistransferase [candidate division WOR-1 bacterium RIFOXYA12_FULL_52_29]|uniref:Isoprenyl transferase n=1 Tax=candidate division WOR-1 bacterium RIFOXYC12_FULL_54_18 TaxID=1802584 RepID=A0A1F4T7A8_UNCSA|nr:MAG: di-trans,poly-cis-decaprenylcistransferase [candidate division WOR-1 bacterium RIFOXYA2_FULL_51_19]OGC17992.1 MAG: di-trans,poly-cis-decaprenylcistransferase [candidate division WOR-1 bacterium RIFOXYA12_FULL_52_29]OGC26848.1 MAG: di-trans,poly-cis-decaprenylcistransferase [candidate division WOR-1 bacterium RIFOXYB2_FULL_45_9]OGC28409.1 MAG: di-trans,poly-cis-decaprenylcistransferase [candidate division WOR-1 bacterium RIFOXYC12_FULL_54_18]OGC31136.1 MAG: di-trans,poly-cis-decaprenylci